MSSIETGIGDVSFRLTIQKIRKLTSICSNVVIVQDLPWKIEVYRREAKDNTNSIDTLSVYLHCLNSDKSKWFCAATATLHLQSFKSNRSSLINAIQPWVFCADEPVWSCKGFVRWTDLFDANNGYVQNDQIIIDVKISARKIQHSVDRSFRLNTITGNSAKLSFQITNVSDLMAATTSAFVFSGLQWKIVVRRKRYADGANWSEWYLGIDLFCATNETSKWKRNIFAKCTLKSDRKAHTESFDEVKKYSNSCRNRGFGKFLLWSTLMAPQNGFVQNGSVMLEVEILDHSDNGDSNNNSNGNSSRQMPANPRIEMSCSICLDDMIGRELLSSTCGHIYCKACILDSIAVRRRCPNCQKHLDKKDLHPIYLPL